MTLKEAKEKFPHIAVSVHWSIDEYSKSDWGKEEWNIWEDADDWQGWQAEVRASTVKNGELITASAYLGRVWEAYGLDPSKINADVSGYLPQMIDDAIEELNAK